MNLKACLVNVGANSSHGSLRSPLFPDGKFEYVPIPDPFITSNSAGLRYCKLRENNGIAFTEFLDKRYHEMCAHYDPEFETYTYGDYPTYHPRAGNLSRLSIGDLIFFFSRLVHWNQKFTNEAGFYLIGFIKIKKIYRNLDQKPGPDVFHEIKKNAHVIRGEFNSHLYDGFWVFKGSSGSRRFEYAIPFDRKFIEGTGLTDAKGNIWKWHKFATELSAIGSYLRSCKLIQGKRLLESFRNLINKQLNTNFH